MICTLAMPSRESAQNQEKKLRCSTWIADLVNMRAFKHHFSYKSFLPILDMKRRGKGHCCDLLYWYIACKAHWHHCHVLAVLWLWMEARVKGTTTRSGRMFTFWLRSWQQWKTKHFIIVYKFTKAFYHCSHKNSAFSCGFMCDWTTKPKQLLIRSSGITPLTLTPTLSAVTK